MKQFLEHLKKENQILEALSYSFVRNNKVLTSYSISFIISAIPRPKSTYTLDKVLDEKESLLFETVNDICEDDFVNAPELPETPPVKAFADSCRHAIQTSTDTLAAALIQFQVVLNLLWPVIHIADRFSTPAARKDASLTAWWSLRVESSFEKAVASTFEFLIQREAPSMFVQMVIRILHEKLLVNHERPITEPTKAKASVKLNAKEQNALRYVCGYIVARLPRKVAKKPQKEGFMDVIANMKRDHDKDTKLNYTREWVEARSRGGLQMVNDMTFLFFQEIERCVRENFPTNIQNLRGADIRIQAAEFSLKDRVIIGKWTHIVAPAGLPENSVLYLLQLVVDFYIQIRGFSYARNIVERYKVKTKSQEKKSKGIRKSLKRAAEESPQ